MLKDDKLRRYQKEITSRLTYPKKKCKINLQKLDTLKQTRKY